VGSVRLRRSAGAVPWAVDFDPLLPSVAATWEGSEAEASTAVAAVDSAAVAAGTVRGRR
jgi:hypothetical protein